jgi:hypothetical protein
MAAVTDAEPDLYGSGKVWQSYIITDQKLQAGIKAGSRNIKPATLQQPAFYISHPQFHAIFH